MLPDKIADRVINMKDIDRLPFIKIAAKLTPEGIKTIEGSGEWDRRQVYMLYHQAKKKL
ncbi:MAG: hypothetical protein J7K32_05725 [Deltaproteobacteria bacterium]|nr:hypothetical protein [Deltaproteobacteria bacterium]